jgi:hypothetical protein
VRLSVDGERFLELPVALLKDDDLAKATNARVHMKTELFNVTLDLLPPLHRIAAKDASSFSCQKRASQNCDGYKKGYKVSGSPSDRQTKGPRLRAFLSSGGRI